MNANTTPKVITLANLAEASEQEVADHIVFRLAGQRFRQSVDLHGECAYRGEMGRACAAGHCMSDAEFEAIRADFDRNSDTIEGQPWQALAGIEGVPIQHVDLIGDFQEAHDNGRTPDLMADGLRDVLIERELSPALLDRILDEANQPAAS